MVSKSDRSSASASSSESGALLGVDPHHLGPAVVHQVHLGLGAGHRLGEVDDPLVLPAGLEALEPLDVGGPLVADAHRARRALEDVDLLGRPGDLGHHLDGGGAGADDADPLVGQPVHRLGGAAAGVARSPSGWCGRPCPRSPRCRGCPAAWPCAGCPRPTPGSGSTSRSPRLVVTCQRRASSSHSAPVDVGLEEGVGVEVEGAGQQLGVLEDLGGAGVALGRHEAGLLEEREVDVRLDVAHAARVAVPVPGATEVARLLDDPEVGDPVLAEVDRGEHPGEAAAHDHDGRLLDHRVAGEAGLDERVPVEILDRPSARATGPCPPGAGASAAPAGTAGAAGPSPLSCCPVPWLPPSPVDRPCRLVES